MWPLLSRKLPPSSLSLTLLPCGICISSRDDDQLFSVNLITPTLLPPILLPPESPPTFHPPDVHFLGTSLTCILVQFYPTPPTFTHRCKRVHLLHRKYCTQTEMSSQILLTQTVMANTVFVSHHSRINYSICCQTQSHMYWHFLSGISALQKALCLDTLAKVPCQLLAHEDTFSQKFIS